MSARPRQFALLCACIGLLFGPAAPGESQEAANSATPDEARPLHLAVATNFVATAKQLADAFTLSTRYPVVLSSGSTGKLYAQIINGAPFDVFLAADEERPARLERAGRGVPGSRFTYARGRLALWSNSADYVIAGKLPNPNTYEHLAIANPRLAPYGVAARQTLVSLDAWKVIEPKLVLGESIGQTFQFVASGNARLGLIAASQLPSGEGSGWLIPAEFHQPIEQQALLINEYDAARAFLNFLQSPAARKLISEQGYDVSED